MAESLDEESYDILFEEPDDYRQKTKPPSFAEHTLASSEILRVRLVGHNPLWGHVLWNAARVTSEYLEESADTLVKGKDVLELGAGAGVPSLVCALQGARKVVITDYPDQDLIDNIHYNVENCDLLARKSPEVHVQGYLWGQPLSLGMDPSPVFDLLVLADLVFNHSEHQKLITTIKKTLKRSPESKALVFFTPHRPWLLSKDLEFFELARQAGFETEHFMEKLMDSPMYEEDRGDETLRRTVYGYQISWSLSGCNSDI